jgi:anti-sigma factor RsiW
MNNVILSHPSNAELTAFGLGRLSDAQSAAIEQHLTECDTCRQTVESLPPDSFIGKVQAAVRPSEVATEAGQATPARPADSVTRADFSGSASTAVPAELTNHPRYRIDGLLGVGGMGAVFKAQHLRMQRPVALKVINRALVSNPGMVERFQREVQAAAKLHHPNIVTAYDAGGEG